MIDFTLNVPDSDELGPGSDLVISMFALAMLALALVGSGVGANETEVKGLIDEKVALSKQISDLDRQVVEDRTALTTLRSKIEGDTLSKKRLIDENGRLLNNLKELKEISAHASQVEKDLLVDSQMINQKDDEIEALKQQIEKKKTIDAVSRQPAIPDNSLLTLRDSAGKSYFRQGSSSIGSEDRNQLLIRLRGKADLIKAKKFNVILVEGYASPETKQAGDAVDPSERLAFERAAAIERIMVDARVPRKCLGVMSFGRNRSDILFGTDVQSARRTESDVVRFDDDYRAGRTRITEERLASERRIEVRALLDPTYNLCTPEELGNSLQTIKQQ